MLLLENLQQFDVELADFFITLASTGLLLFLLLASLCAPVLAVITESAYKLRQKPSTTSAPCRSPRPVSHWACCCRCRRQRRRPRFPAVSGTVPTVPAMGRPSPIHPAVRTAPGGPDSACPLPDNLERPEKLRVLHIPLGLCAGLPLLGILFTAFLFLGALQEPVLTLIFRTAPITVFQALLLDFLDSPTSWLGFAYLFSSVWSPAAPCRNCGCSRAGLGPITGATTTFSPCTIAPASP